MRQIITILLASILALGISAITCAAGWEQVNNDWYYLGYSGQYLKNTWIYSEGKNYYVGADGKMLTGEHTIVYRTCTFDENGALVEEGTPMDVTRLDYGDLCGAQRMVQDYWPAIVKGYEMVNAEREANGTHPILLNYDLCVAAAYRSKEMIKMGAEKGSAFYSGPDENGEMLWNTVPRALTGNTSYIGTENKSYHISDRLPSDGGVTDLSKLLASQFRSEAHYAQIIGKEYSQIGIGVWYEKGRSYYDYRLTELIKVGEFKWDDLME